MSELSDTPVKTFSIGFEDRSFSELPFARQVAERYGTEHHEYFVKPDVTDLLPELIHHHECSVLRHVGPFRPYYVCKIAREQVTVALSGDGVTSFLPGTTSTSPRKHAGYFRKLPTWLRERVVQPMVDAIPESTSYINKGRVAREFVRAADLDSRQRYERWTAKIKPETRQGALSATALRGCLSEEHSAHIAQLFDSQPDAPSSASCYMPTSIPNWRGMYWSKLIE